MIIKMLKTAQGPMGCFLKGKEIPVSDEFGETLIKANSAIEIKGKAEPKKEEKKEEPKKDEVEKIKNPFKKKGKKNK